jgi:hypothetical protein
MPDCGQRIEVALRRDGRVRSKRSCPKDRRVRSKRSCPSSPSLPLLPPDRLVRGVGRRRPCARSRRNRTSLGRACRQGDSPPCQPRSPPAVGGSAERHLIAPGDSRRCRGPGRPAASIGDRGSPDDHPASREADGRVVRRFGPAVCVSEVSRPEVHRAKGTTGAERAVDTRASAAADVGSPVAVQVG